MSIKVLSLFSGIGAYEKALERLNVDFEVVNYCEVDKYASKAYSLIHGVPEEKNLGDISLVNVDEIPEVDLITWSWPCTSLSFAGHKEGFIDKDGNVTASGLFFEGLRIIKAKKPKIAICENVKGLVSERFKKEFGIVISSLRQIGYKSYYAVLNSKDYGVPQNRERVFIVSIREDIDEGFTFPKPLNTDIRLKDVLLDEDKVDKKFYLSEKALAGKIAHKERHKDKGNGFGFQLKSDDDIASTILARYYKDGSECLIQRKIIQTAQIYPNSGNPEAGRIYDPNGLSPTVTTCNGGNRMPKVELGEGIRRLTPLECFRLFGFDDEDCEVLTSNGISNTRQYKMAGNSIVVNVLEEIFKSLTEQYPTVFS